MCLRVCSCVPGWGQYGHYLGNSQISAYFEVKCCEKCMHTFWMGNRSHGVRSSWNAAASQWWLLICRLSLLMNEILMCSVIPVFSFHGLGLACYIDWYWGPQSDFFNNVHLAIQLVTPKRSILIDYFSVSVGDKDNRCFCGGKLASLLNISFLMSLPSGKKKWWSVVL